MKYLSHLYFRIDGSLGRFPIIEISPDGTIISIEEHEDTIVEQQSVKFYSGVLVPSIDCDNLTFDSYTDFVQKIKSKTARVLAVGENPGLCVISNFDLKTFVAKNAIVTKLK